jgi:hypothetical protein
MDGMDLLAIMILLAILGAIVVFVALMVGFSIARRRRK